MNYTVFVSTVLLAIRDLNDPDANVWKALSGSRGDQLDFAASNIVHLAPVLYLQYFVVSRLVRCFAVALGFGLRNPPNGLLTCERAVASQQSRRARGSVASAPGHTHRWPWCPWYRQTPTIAARGSRTTSASLTESALLGCRCWLPASATVRAHQLQGPLLSPRCDGMVL